MDSLQALISIIDGNIIEYGERYYKYDISSNEVKYSDDRYNWNSSNITINEFLKVDFWNQIN